MRKIITTLFLMLVSICWGQAFTNYDSDDGLIEGIVSNILIDDQGVAWFVDWSESLPGIGSFDGTNWQQYGPDDGASGFNYHGLHQSPDGDYWFGSYIFATGLDRFDGSNWITYTQADGLIGNEVAELLQGIDGNLWLINGGANGGGLSNFDGTTFVNYLADGVILPQTAFLHFDQDSQGRFWLASVDVGVVMFDLVGYTQYGIQEGLSADRFETILVDDQDQVWAGAHVASGGGLNYFDGSTWRVYTQSDGLPDDSIRAIFQDSQGNMWFGTDAGISRFDGTDFVNFDSTDGLIEDHVRAITEDGQGNIWIGTWDGISVFNPTLGIMDNQQIEWAMAPNPSDGGLRIQSQQSIEQIQIFDFLGRLQLSVDEPMNDKLDLSRLSAGSYWVVVRDQQGNSAFKQLLLR